MVFTKKESAIGQKFGIFIIFSLCFIILYFALCISIKSRKIKIHPFTAFTKEDQFQDLLDLKVNATDSRLIDYIRSKLKSPIKRGTVSYNLKNSAKNDIMDWNPTQLTYEFKATTYGYLDKIGNGEDHFYIDCGANDGEFFSNTLFLERFKNWSGILIEPNPILIERLNNKNRVAWILNMCLSKKPEKNQFYHLKNDRSGAFDKLGPNKDYLPAGGFSKKIFRKIAILECVPLYSVLLALNITTVDFFSLDIEGYEYYVLESIPFNLLTFKVILVEVAWAPLGLKKKLLNLMESNNFELKGGNGNDYLFVHSSFV